MTKKKETWQGVAAIVILATIAGYFFYADRESGPATQTPTVDTSSWVLHKDDTTNITYKYPVKVDYTYLGVMDWPPGVQLLPQIYTCTQAGNAHVPAGQTVERIIGGTRYCITTETQGATGNIYTNYAYAFSKDLKTVILTFSVHAQQCLNYEEPEQSKCETAEASFNPDQLADAIARTVTLSAQ